jgi:hypothetical protein
VRLMDLIVQGRSAAVRTAQQSVLPSAARFVEPIRTCPLRCVLADDLTRCATELAFAEGDQLSGCVDLLHVPAQSLWIEWAESPRQEALRAIPSLAVLEGSPCRRAGALITASTGCRSGYLRTFWSTAEELAYLSPLITHFDFDIAYEKPAQPPSLWRGETLLTLADEPAIDALLRHLRFNFDEEWASYYRSKCSSGEQKDEVLRACMAGCAYDAPMIFAFFLLLAAAGSLPHQAVRHEGLNCKRRRAGKSDLLEHTEYSGPLAAPVTNPWQDTQGDSWRSRPRLHHVRGHIVRRGSTIFWRSPHLRGNARFGRVVSRTITLSFDQRSPKRLTSL